MVSFDVFPNPGKLPTKVDPGDMPVPIRDLPRGRTVLDAKKSQSIRAKSCDTSGFLDKKQFVRLPGLKDEMSRQFQKKIRDVWFAPRR